MLENVGWKCKVKLDLTSSNIIFNQNVRRCSIRPFIRRHERQLYNFVLIIICNSIHNCIINALPYGCNYYCLPELLCNIRALGKVYTSTHNTCLIIHSLLSFTKVILYVQLQNRSDRETLTRNLKCWCW